MIFIQDYSPAIKSPFHLYAACMHDDGREEREECLKMHSVMSQYSLHGSMRWLIAQTDKIKNGELYRYRVMTGSDPMV